LHDDRRFFRVDSRRNKQRRGFADFFRKLFRILVHRDCVQIDDAEDALVIALDFRPVLQSPEIVA
jgi:hypothetical protein